MQLIDIIKKIDLADFARLEELISGGELAEDQLDFLRYFAEKCKKVGICGDDLLELLGE